MSDSRTELDERLVAALKTEPRATVLSLAETTGFPRAVVATRLKELQESGDVRVVGATHPMLSGARLIAAVSIAVTGPVMPVIEFLKTIEEAVYVSTVSGPFEIVMELRVADQDELLQVLEEVRAAPEINRIETLTYGRVIKGYLSQNELAEISLDVKDRQLIGALGEDGRKSWQELADIVSLSPSAVRTRVNRLLESNAMRIVVMERGGRYGRVISTTAFLTLNADGDAILAKISEDDAVEFAITAFGKCDAVLVIRSRSQASLFEALERIRSMPEVTKVETRTQLQQFKEVFSRIL
ncbi:Lrp/AsnC family transcriptional regulator [Gulosibacter chungangensis]|uniref:AsnC family transcriptional regulator n=1 Tax=Gulosibacter chungangensis TaxID=979746 RepID=A0A7J5BBH2_9MICO|nr:AsnC family transcriptional regulator [Gulosibacter chungangensis]KAB1641912.1 AsnC family transcriptional regulator [Gulosibacter chungangensis]